MVDEIELVRRFRSDLPDPSPQARAQAWGAVMAVAAQEGAEEETVATLPRPPSRRRWSPGTGRRVVAVVAALVVTAAVLTVALSVTNRPNHVRARPLRRGSQANQ